MTQEILIPYEKGPPEKLLSKIIFRDRQTKEVTLETGVKIQVPLFVKAGDLVVINTESGEYVERA